MKLKIEDWNGDLAVRLPDWLVAKYGIKEGDPFDWSGVEAALLRDDEGRQKTP